MNFSSRTSSLDVQRNLEANVEKRTKDTYGPPPGRRLLIFIDDMNMPQVGFNEPMYRIYVYFTQLVKSFKAFIVIFCNLLLKGKLKGNIIVLL